MAVKTFGTEVLTSADTNTYLANSGLVYVAAYAVTGSPSSLTLTGAFSSTYDNYLIQFDNVATSQNAAYLKMSMGSTITGYYNNGYYSAYTSNAINGEVNSNVVPNWNIGFTTSSSNTNVNIAIELHKPNLAKNTGFISNWVTEAYNGSFRGYLNDTTQYTACTFTPGTGTFSGGTVYVYGYRKV